MRQLTQILYRAKEAGAKIIKPADDTFWGGYAGYFQDPDGHLWEVVWNPEMKIEDWSPLDLLKASTKVGQGVVPYSHIG